MDTLPPDLLCFSEKDCEILSAQAEREGELKRGKRGLEVKIDSRTRVDG